MMSKKDNDNVETEHVEMTASAPVSHEPLAAAEQVTLIYVGPNVAGSPLKQFQVFRGGLPKYIEAEIEKIPEIKGLIIPVEKLETARRKIKAPGTNEARLFDTVLKAAKEAK